MRRVSKSEFEKELARHAKEERAKKLPKINIQEVLRREFPGVEIYISDRSNPYSGIVWFLDTIVIPEDKRNQGIGTKAMNKFCEHADDHQAIIALSPASDFGSSLSRLKRFYTGFGFIPNTGRKARNDITGAMIRFPK